MTPTVYRIAQEMTSPTGLGAAFNDTDLLNVANSVPPLINQSFSVSSVAGRVCFGV